MGRFDRPDRSTSWYCGRINGSSAASRGRNRGVAGGEDENIAAVLVLVLQEIESERKHQCLLMVGMGEEDGGASKYIELGVA